MTMFCLTVVPNSIVLLFSSCSLASLRMFKDFTTGRTEIYTSKNTTQKTHKSLQMTKMHTSLFPPRYHFHILIHLHQILALLPLQAKEALQEAEVGLGEVAQALVNTLHTKYGEKGKNLQAKFLFKKVTILFSLHITKRIKQ